MLAKILGIIWIVLGLLWIARPRILKNRLQKKMDRKLRRVVFGFVLVFGFLMIGSVITAEGLLPKIIGLIGIIITIKAILLFTSKASEKIINWLAGKPLIFFRIWAVFILAIGLALMFV